MSLFKIINCKGKYHDDDAREDVIRYACNPQKTPHRFIGGAEVDLSDPIASMEEVANRFNKNKGVRLRHFVLSFAPTEVSSPALANQIGQDIMEELGAEYQAIYAVHEDTDDVHLHIVMNTVSHIDGHKYRGSKKEYYDLLYMLRAILRFYGIKKMIPVKGGTPHE